MFLQKKGKGRNNSYLINSHFLKLVLFILIMLVVINNQKLFSRLLYDAYSNVLFN